jgi:hypothetical protein
LQVEVKRSVRRLAKRIDDGYSIEVRSFLPPTEDEEHAEGYDGVGESEIEAARAIGEQQPRTRRMNLTGRPTLELTEGDEEDDVSPERGSENRVRTDCLFP